MPSPRSLEVLVPVAGLVYGGLLLLYEGLFFFGLQSPLTVIIVVFALAFLGSAFGIWRRTRVGYIAAITSTVLIVLMFGAQVVGAWASPGNTRGLFVGTTIFTMSVAVLAYSVLGLRITWGKTIPQTNSRTIPLSSIIVLLGLGFIMGGLAVGFLAGEGQARLLESSAVPADITILKGSSSPSSAEFYGPAKFEAKVGQKITWVNRDTNAHTVTSDTGVFDSDNILSGASWSHTFAKAGLYEYHCTPHPWMKATVIVKEA